jgi:hypothetical protein
LAQQSPCLFEKHCSVLGEADTPGGPHQQSGPDVFFEKADLTRERRGQHLQTSRPLGARAAYCLAIYQSLRKYGIEVPFPQRDLHVKTSVPLRVDLGDGGRETVRRPAEPRGADGTAA